MNTFSADQDPRKHIEDELYAILPVVEQVRMLHTKGRYGFDICPQNIVMTRRGAMLRVKDITLGADGASVFRPGYTPRERYMGGMVGPWTDVYAVSALVYTAMTGLMLPSAFERGNAEPLFGGLDERYSALEDAVTQGLASDVGARLKSLDALYTQIQACLAGYNLPTLSSVKIRKPMNCKQITVAVIIAVLLLLCGAALVNEVNYAEAVSHTLTGEYAMAQNSLKGVFGFYKDAAKLADYAGAGICLDNGEYGAALNSFSELGSYRDCKDMVKETDYRHAQALMEKGNLAEAEALLKRLDGYKDAVQMLAQISFENGIMFLDAGMYLSALNEFQSIPDYAGAAEKAEEVKDKLYAAAISALSEGHTDTAAKYFAALPEYKKADTLIELTALLSRIQSGSAVSQDDYRFITGFADTIDLSLYLTSDSLIGYYLCGRWRDNKGNVFETDESGGIVYTIFGAEGSGEKLGDGVLYLGEDAVLRFNSIDLNTVEIYAFEDGETYVMSRR